MKHSDIDHTGLTGVGPAADILDLPTVETDDTLVLAPDGAGGVEFRAEAGGGGSGSQAYLGYNTVGASSGVLTANLTYMRKITVPTGGGFLMTIEGYVKGNADGAVHEARASVYIDSAGAPTVVTASNALPVDSIYMNTTQRWLAIPVGVFLPAGDCWIAWETADNSMQMAFDTGGSTSDNKTLNAGAYRMPDVGMEGTLTGVTNIRSLRASMLYL